MAVKGYFYNSVNRDRIYNGQDMNEDKAPFYKEGVVYGHLGVTAGKGMTVKVDGGSRTGYAYINLHTIHNTTVMELQVSQASGNLPRIDRVVLRNNESERKPSILILEGAYSSKPQPPALTNTNVIQEKCLAEIFVAAGAVEITQADITDTRANTSLCGFVASQFQELNFEQLAAQFNTWFLQKKEVVEKSHADFVKKYEELTKSFMNNQQAEWEDWFFGIQEILMKTENGSLLEEVKRLYEELYHMATDGDIDRIINDQYTDEDENGIFETATNEDIDSIIDEVYIESEDDKSEIADEKIKTIVNDAFNRKEN